MSKKKIIIGTRGSKLALIYANIVKKKLFELGDAFLILPGGSGTIEEATEVISWKFLELHNKDIIIFNYKNYWEHLINLYNQSLEKNFSNKNFHDICLSINTLNEFKKIF